MKLLEQEKDYLLQQVQTFIDKDGMVEWEFSFGNSHHEPKNYFSTIDKGLFQNLIRRLNSHGDLTRQDPLESLDITIPETNIRCTLEGRENILLFCREDLGVLESMKFVHKRFYDKSSNISSIKMYDTSSYEKKDYTPTNYGIKSNMKYEINFDINNQIRSDSTAEKDRDKLLNQILDNNIGNIYKVKKTFRYKKRISYLTNEGFHIDLTILKTSTTPYFSFKEANILNRSETYEVEIECNYLECQSNQDNFIKEKEAEEGELLENLDKNILLDNMIKYSGIILQVQQDSAEITSINIAQAINIELNDQLSEIIQFYIQLRNTGNNTSIDNINIVLNLLGVKPLTNKINEPINRPGPQWPGPKPVSLEMKQLQKSVNGNILEYYTVTDKADGEGNLLYFNGDGYGYLIDPNNRCRFTGVRCTNEANTLLNGEYISRNLNGELNYSFHIYDIYIRKGEPVHLLPLCLPSIIESKIISLHNKSEFKIKKNKVYNLSLDESIVEDTELIGSNYWENIKINLDKYVIVFDNNGNFQDTNREYSIQTYDNEAHNLILNSIEKTVKCSDNSKIRFRLKEDLKNELLPTRLQHLNECIVELDIITNKNLPIFLKKFHFSDLNEASNNSIFELSRKCWEPFKSGLSSYKYDGMIYTPMLYPAGYSEKINSYDLLQGKTWEYNYKWKPLNENSIDFLVNIDKKIIYQNRKTLIERDNVYNKTIIDDTGKVESIKYKTLNLYVGGLINNSFDGCRPNRNKTYTKKNFSPKLPYKDNIDKANIILENGNIFGMDDRNIIENDSIVEFYYESSKAEGFQWIPKRVRYDKTFEYHNNLNFQRNLFYVIRSFIKKDDINELKIFRNNLSKINFDYNQYYSSNPKQLEWSILYFRNGSWEITTPENIRKRYGGIENDLQNTIDKDGSWLWCDYDFNRNSVRGNKNITSNLIIRLLLLYYVIVKNNLLRDNLYSSLYDFLKRNFNNIIQDPSNIPIKGIKYGNDEKVANSVWKTINCPITEAIISTGNGIVSTENEQDIYYDKSNLSNRKYSNTIMLQRYHNFIKRHYLLRCGALNCNRNSSIISILDLACGKGGDLSKWKDINAVVVVGFDKVVDNLKNINDGACVRYNEMVKNAKTDRSVCPHVYFMQADCSKNIIKKFRDSTDREETDMFLHLWNISKDWDNQPYNPNESDKKQPISNNYQNIYPNFSHNKFNIVSIQFALHYFYENKEGFDNLLKNISDNLSNNGLFMGCCLDGDLVNSKFKQVGNSVVNGSIDDNIIWRLTKKYSDTDYKLGDNIIYYDSKTKNMIPSVIDKIDSDIYTIKLNTGKTKKVRVTQIKPNLSQTGSYLGREIDVYMSSINKTHTEYLVDFDFLTYMLSSYNIVPLDDTDITELKLPSSYNKRNGTIRFDSLKESIIQNQDYWEGINTTYITNLLSKKMSEAEQEISFLNSAFIYKNNS